MKIGLMSARNGPQREWERGREKIECSRVRMGTTLRATGNKMYRSELGALAEIRWMYRVHSNMWDFLRLLWSARVQGKGVQSASRATVWMHVLIEMRSLWYRRVSSSVTSESASSFIRCFPWCLVYIADDEGRHALSSYTVQECIGRIASNSSRLTSFIKVDRPGMHPSFGNVHATLNSSCSIQGCGFK